eukprot:4918499-Prymnesium_polylepis.1
MKWREQDVASRQHIAEVIGWLLVWRTLLVRRVDWSLEHPLRRIARVQAIRSVAIASCHRVVAIGSCHK